MRIPRINKLLHQYPSFLDRCKTSNHYRVNNVMNDSYNHLRMGLNKLDLSRTLDRPILIWKEQSQSKHYTIHFQVHLKNIKEVKIYKLDPSTQDSVLLYNERFSDESETEIFTYETSESSSSIIPKTEYLISVETWDEYKYVKGFPENEECTGLWHNTYLDPDTSQEDYKIHVDLYPDEIDGMGDVKVFQLHNKVWEEQSLTWQKQYLKSYSISEINTIHNKLTNILEYEEQWKDIDLTLFKENREYISSILARVSPFWEENFITYLDSNPNYLKVLLHNNQDIIIENLEKYQGTIKQVWVDVGDNEYIPLGSEVKLTTVVEKREETYTSGDEYFDRDEGYTCDYLLYIESSDDYFMTTYFGVQDECMSVSCFNHDQVLDLIGGNLDIRRLQLNPVYHTEYPTTYPSFCNRFEEDDYHYHNRIQEYILRLPCNIYSKDDVDEGVPQEIVKNIICNPTRNLTELEIWKNHLVTPKLYNRKRYILEQDQDYMWENSCDEVNEEQSIPTSLSFITSPDATILDRKLVKVHVTSSENSSETSEIVIDDVLEGNVTFTLYTDNTRKTVKEAWTTPLFDGYASINFIPESFKEIPISAVYSGSDLYSSTELVNQDLKVHQRTPQLTAPIVMGNQGDTDPEYNLNSVDLNVNVSYKKKPVNVGKIVFLYGNNQSVGTADVINGLATFKDFKIPSSWGVGEHYLKIKYFDEEDGIYADLDDIIKVFILKVPDHSRLDSVYYFNSGISLRLLSSPANTEDYTSLSDSTLHLYQNETEIAHNKTDNNGYCFFESKGTGEEFDFTGEDIISVYYHGDDEHRKIREQIYPIATQYTPITSINMVFINPKTVFFKLSDGDGYTLKGKPLMIYCNGKPLLDDYISQTNNWIRWDLPSDVSDEDIYSIKYNGDKYYAPCIRTVPTSNISDGYNLFLPDVRGIVGGTASIYAKLRNKNGYPVTDKYINFYVDDYNFAGAWTGTDGISNINYPVNTINADGDFITDNVFTEEGKYTLKAEFIENEVTVTKTASLTVSKGTPTKIKCSDTGIESEDIISAQLLDVYDNPIPDKVISAFAENEFVGKARTDEEGKALIPVDYGVKNVSFDEVHLALKFKADTVYASSYLNITDFRISKAQMCIHTTPEPNSNVNCGFQVETYVYDCKTGKGINDIQVEWYFERVTNGDNPSQWLKPRTTRDNLKGEKGYARMPIFYAVGKYFLGVTVTDPKGRYATRSTVINPNTGKEWLKDDGTPGKYLYSINIVDNREPTSIKINSTTVESGDNLLVTLVDSGGKPLSDKEIHFYDPNHKEFQTSTTDGNGQAMVRFTCMTPRENVTMYYGYAACKNMNSDDPIWDKVYAPCESKSLITITPRNLEFRDLNIKSGTTVENNEIALSGKITDTKGNCTINYTDYVVTLKFQQYFKTTGEVSKEWEEIPLHCESDGSFMMNSTISLPDINTVYYTYTLSFQHKYNSADPWFLDKISAPVKFFITRGEGTNGVTIDLDTNPNLTVAQGSSFDLIATIKGDLLETGQYDIPKGYVKFINKNNVTVGQADVDNRTGQASCNIFADAPIGETLNFYAQFISTDYHYHDYLSTAEYNRKYTYIKVVDKKGLALTNLSVNQGDTVLVGQTKLSGVLYNSNNYMSGLEDKTLTNPQKTDYGVNDVKLSITFSRYVKGFKTGTTHEYIVTSHSSDGQAGYWTMSTPITLDPGKDGEYKYTYTIKYSHENNLNDTYYADMETNPVWFSTAHVSVTTPIVNLYASPNTVSEGDTYTLTARVDSSITGTIYIENQNKVVLVNDTIKNGIVSTSGVVSSSQVSTFVFTAHFISDTGDYNDATSNQVTVNVVKASTTPTSTTVKVNNSNGTSNQLVKGDTYTITASTISEDGVIGTGKVSIRLTGDGVDKVVSSGTLVAGSFTSDSLTFSEEDGTYIFYADFTSSNETYADSTGQTPQIKASSTAKTTTTSLTSISPYSGSATGSFKVGVNVTSSSGTPTGKVLIYMGGEYISEDTLSNGTVTVECNYSNKSSGSYLITAHYEGDSTYGNSDSSNSYSFGVTGSGQDAGLSIAAPSFLTVDEEDSAYASVKTGAYGNITIYVDGVEQVTQGCGDGIPITADLKFTSTGTHTVSAKYVSNNDEYASSSSNVSRTITVKSASSTSTPSVSLSGVSSAYTVGDSGTWTANVVNRSGGTLYIYWKGSSVASTSSSDQLTYGFSASSAGTWSVYARYTSSAGVNYDSSTYTVTISNPASSSVVSLPISVSSNASGLVEGSAASFTVTAYSSNSAANGKTIYLEGPYANSTRTMSGGSCSWSISVPASEVNSGSFTYTASVYGYDNYTGSGSTSVSVSSLVNPNLSLSVTSQAVYIGQAVSYTASVPSASGTLTILQNNYTAKSGTVNGGGSISTGTSSATSDYLGSNSITATFHYNNNIKVFNAGPTTVNVLANELKTFTITPSTSTVYNGTNYSFSIELRPQSWCEAKGTVSVYLQNSSNDLTGGGWAASGTGGVMSTSTYTASGMTQNGTFTFYAVFTPSNSNYNAKTATCTIQGKV